MAGTRRRRRPRAGRDRLLLVGVAAASLLIGYLLGIGTGGPGELPGGGGDGARREGSAAAPARQRPETPAGGERPSGAAPSTTAPAPGRVAGPADSRRPAAGGEDRPSAGAAELPPGGGARVAVVIDDLGRRVADVEDLAALGVPLSYGVLPFETHTGEVVEALRRRRQEILVHLPMEPRNGADPGPGALTAAMSEAEIGAATRWALHAVAGATGVNNHMGSQLTGDRRTMEVVLGVLGEEGLFYLDSRTSADSVAYRLALELGVPAAERQVFLDAAPEPAAIRAEFRRLLALARERGSAVAIGHPYPATLAVLREELPAARAAGYRFVPVGALVVDRRMAAAGG